VSAVAISVWFRLLRVHGLLLRQVRRSVPDHLTLPRFDVMAQLHRRAEGMTPGELTRALLVTAGNVTGIVDRLVREGLAERRPLPGDRRTLLVRLTPRGRRTMERAIPRHRRDVQAVLAAVPRAELRRLRQALGCAMRALEVRGPRPGQVMRGSTADRLYTGAVLKERK
jgi:DNA-binding MarR family transcriptional regulator